MTEAGVIIDGKIRACCLKRVDWIPWFEEVSATTARYEHAVQDLRMISASNSELLCIKRNFCCNIGRNRVDVAFFPILWHFQWMKMSAATRQKSNRARQATTAPNQNYCLVHHRPGPCTSWLLDARQKISLDAFRKRKAAHTVTAGLGGWINGCVIFFPKENNTKRPTGNLERSDSYY